MIPRKGSSPLTRGKLGTHDDALRDRGLIPAHAGKTTATSRAHVVSRAHPRSRGENAGGRRRARVDNGSSPLTRGKPVLHRRHGPEWRLIPAHAGKTRRPRPLVGAGPAHPRSRGENPRVAARATVRSGSSPLTRGKLDAVPDAGDDLRLIPAHAGKTIALDVGKGRRKAHPRSRGENFDTSCAPYSETGSSPLTRGKPRKDRTAQINLGLIPAHAGKTSGPRRILAARSAHPRSRGENDTLDLSLLLVPGSSPLTRGKPRQSGGVA